MGKFGKGEDSEDPKKPTKGDGKSTDADTEAQIAELMKLSAEMKKSNGTVKLGVETVPLERLPMGREEMAEARRRYALPMSTL